MNYPDGMTRADWIHVGEISDPIETVSDKLESFFEKRGYSPESIDDIAWALHEMRLFIEPESGDVDLTDDELECILAEIKPGLDEYFDDTEEAA